MAYQFSPFDNEEDKKKQEEENSVSTGENVIGGSGGIITGNNPSQGTGQGTRSGSWTNLNSYLDVNKDQAFGSKVAGKVEDEVNNAQNVQNTVTNDFKSRVDSNRVDYNPTLVNEATSNATEFVKDQDKVNQFTKQRDAEYKGPVQLNDAEDLFNQATTATNKAKEASEASKTEEGRFGLLDRYFSRPDYNQGMKSLDNLLVQNDQDSRQKFLDVQGKGTQVSNNLTDTQNNLNQYAQSAKQTTEQARVNARKGLTDSVNIMDSALNTKVSSYNKDQEDYYQQLLKDLGNTKEADSGFFNQLTTPDQNEFRTYGQDPLRFLSDVTDASKGNVSTTEEKARLNALLSLAGREVIDPSQYDYASDKSESYNPNNKFKFEKDRFLSSIKDQESGFNQMMSDKSFASERTMNDLNGFAQSMGLGPINNINDLVNVSNAYEAWLTGPSNVGRPSYGEVGFGRGYDSLVDAQRARDIANQRIAEANSIFNPSSVIKRKK